MDDTLGSVRMTHKMVLLTLFVALCGMPTLAYGDMLVEDVSDIPVAISDTSVDQAKKSGTLDALPVDGGIGSVDADATVLDGDLKSNESEEGKVLPDKSGGDEANALDQSIETEFAESLRKPDGGEVENALDDEEAAVLAPRIALVSAGANNRYGHPTDETLARLDAAGARIYRTDEQGDVSCKLADDRIDVRTLR